MTYFRNKHKRLAAEFDAINQAINTTTSDIGSNPPSTSNPFTIAQRFPIIDSTELKRLLANFIIANNLSIRSVISETFRAILARLDPQIPRISV